MDGLRYTHVIDERLAVWLHYSHPLAGRSELTSADLHGQKVTLLGGPVGRASGYNKAIRGLFAGTGIEPLIEETLQVYPPAPNSWDSARRARAGKRSDARPGRRDSRRSSRR